jgi:CheY-like chemotaxis protein
MSILIAEDNVAQRRYLRELLEREFSTHLPVIEADVFWSNLREGGTLFVLRKSNAGSSLPGDVVEQGVR